jgi:uncharacterized protein
VTLPEQSIGSDPLAPLAVVTGASSGIGRALARQFADNGFDVLLVADDAHVQNVADGLAATGSHSYAHEADLASADGVQAAYRAITGIGRPVAALALNAGVAVGGGSFAETDLADHLRLIDLNCRSTVHLAGLLLPDMVERDDGRVLITASIAALGPGPYQSTYNASKAFVHFFAEGIRQELRDTHVTVTSLMPGPTDTAMFARGDMEDTRLAQGHKDDPDEVARDGFEAMMAGRDHVVSGSARNKVQAAAASVLPDWLTSIGIEQITRPGTGS